MSQIINNFKTMLTIAVVLSVAFADPITNTSESSNEIVQSESSVTKNNDPVSASTSFGGYKGYASWGIFAVDPFTSKLVNEIFRLMDISDNALRRFNTYIYGKLMHLGQPDVTGVPNDTVESGGASDDGKVGAPMGLFRSPFGSKTKAQIDSHLKYLQFVRIASCLIMLSHIFCAYLYFKFLIAGKISSCLIVLFIMFYTSSLIPTELAP